MWELLLPCSSAYKRFRREKSWWTEKLNYKDIYELFKNEDTISTTKSYHQIIKEKKYYSY